MNYTGIINRHMVLTVLMLSISGLLSVSIPLPKVTDFHIGYLNIYLPFLFIGVLFYIFEQGYISKKTIILSVCYLMFCHLNSVQNFSPRWMNSNFAVLGLVIFSIAWYFRGGFVAAKTCIILSDLTYSVYLFHNWLWSHLKDFSALFFSGNRAQNVSVIVLLLSFCYLSNRLIEKKASKVGRVFIRRKVKAA